MTIETLLGNDGMLAVRPSKNPSLRSVFPLADELFELTSGGCSCDLVIRSSQGSVDDQRARLRAHYHQKGWSQAKIIRALGDWQIAHERRLEKHDRPTRQLCALLRGLALRPAGVRVIVHDYSGQFDTEEVRIAGRASVSADRLVDPRVLGEDALVDIVPAAG